MDRDHPAYPSGKNDGPAVVRQIGRDWLRAGYSPLVPWSAPTPDGPIYIRWADWRTPGWSLPVLLGGYVEWYAQAYVRWLIGRPMKPSSEPLLTRNVSKVAGALGLAGAAAAVVWLYPEYLLRPENVRTQPAVHGAMSESERLERIEGMRRTLASIFGGIGGAIAVGAAWRRSRGIERQAEAQAEQARIANQGQINDRFTRAVDQLGSERVHIRLGGIAALERIAQDQPRAYADTVLEVLSGFLRDRSDQNRRKAEEAEGEVERSRINRTDIRAVGTGIGRLLANGETCGTQPLDLMGCDLYGAKLKGAHLNGANLSEANVEKTDLSGASLLGAHFIMASLDRADLVEANLTGANLFGANLAYANVEKAKFAGANLSGATLTGTLNLTQAQLDSAWAKVDPGLRPKLSEGLNPPPDASPNLGSWPEGEIVGDVRFVPIPLTAEGHRRRKTPV